MLMIWILCSIIVILIDLSSFDTTNANNMKYMLSGCTSLKKEIIKVNKNEEKILESSIFNIF